MPRYDNQKCEGCGGSFRPEDDIVVCPVCGTPQHRECWKNANGCVNEARHGEGFEWKPDGVQEVESEPKEEKDCVCPRCGEKIIPGMLFCTKCGSPLGENKQQDSQPGQNPFGEGAPFNGGFPPPGAVPFGMLFNPYGGLSPDEKIDGVPVKDIAETVQANSAYYLPRFKAMTGGRKKVGWNWGAFIFGNLWYFYRKNYLVGLIYTLVQILLSAIFMVPLEKYQSMYQSLLETPSADKEALAAMLEAIQGVMPQLILFGLISLLVQVAFTLFSNYFYRQKVFKTIAEIKQKADDDETYHLTLRMKGGASFLFGALAYMGTSMLCEFLIVFSQMIFK